MSNVTESLSSGGLMKALRLDSYDASTLLEVEVAKPSPQQGQVLVKIKASGVNPIDYKIRLGQAPYAMPELPAIIGTDLAGVVEVVGEGVTQFQVGDEVYGLTGGVRGLQGSLAQYAAVDANLLAVKPRNLSMREAAALPLVTLTAWEGLVDKAAVKAGDRVLVHGGAGGVGHVAVQLAKAFGADVYATVSPAKQSIIESYGATSIDYQSVGVNEYVAQHTNGDGFDIIYDTVGGESLDLSFQAIRPYGHVVSCAAFSSHNLAPGSLRCMTLSGVFVLLPMLSGKGRSHHGEILRKAAQLAEAGQLKPLVDEFRFTLSQAQTAHEMLERGDVRGKAVIDID